MKAASVLHQDTHSFSQLVIDYLANAPELEPFYQFRPNREGMQQAIEKRKQYPVNRRLLVEVLQEQYQDYELDEGLIKQLELLKAETTFTICTAHQPNLMTGYLYFFFKIIHAARLAQYLKEEFANYDFVPVFYIGSEDNDFEELSVFKYHGKTYRWVSNQTGAVGRMKTDDLTSLMEELKQDLFSSKPEQDFLIKAITEAYEKKETISEAIRYITHLFLGRFGVLVLDADDPRLKREYLKVMEDELIHQTAFPMVQAASKALNELYKAQAYARPINLFYLKDDLRERIVQKDEQHWEVVHTDIVWLSKEALLEELNEHPDRFSPNVILRGPYQETILPDVAFIGGGSEVAYWMQLKQIYDYYHIFFPTLVLRQSALWMQDQEVRLQEKLALKDEDLFESLTNLEKTIVKTESAHDLNLDEEQERGARLLHDIKVKATAIDPTLGPSSEATLAKIKKLLLRLEKKMVRAEKRHHADKMRQLEKLKHALFPGGSLQERHDCFLELYLTYGDAFMQTQYEESFPFGDRFLIIKAS